MRVSQVKWKTKPYVKNATRIQPCRSTTPCHEKVKESTYEDDETKRYFGHTIGCQERSFERGKTLPHSSKFVKQ